MWEIGIWINGLYPMYIMYMEPLIVKNILNSELSTLEAENGLILMLKLVLRWVQVQANLIFLKLRME